MKQRYLTFLLLATTFITGAQLFVIVTTQSPYTAPTETLWSFFISLYAVSTCALTLIWHQIKKLAYRDKTISLVSSLRQAALFACVIVLGLFFRSLHILSLWDTIPLAISALLIEFFFQADKSKATYEPA